MWSVLRVANASSRLLRAQRFGTLVGLLCIAASLVPAGLLAQKEGEAKVGVGAVPSPVPAPIPAEKSPHELATQILHRALHQAVWGKPAWCKVRQQMQVFDQQINSFGSFVRAGEGSGKLKLSLQFPAGDAMNTLLQISDGHRLHTMENLSGVRKRSMIDLDKVRKRLVINDQSIHDPVVALYLAIGGQAESLRKLCQQYEWFSVKSGKYGDQEVWLLSGQLAKAPPIARAYASTDQILTESASGLLPTTVQAVIGKPTADSRLPFWLYQVEHRRESSEPSTLNLRNQLRLVTEWSDPRPIEGQMDQVDFEASASNDPWQEETDRYLPPPLNVASLESATASEQQAF